MRHAPLLLAQPTRCATPSRPLARVILAIVALCVVVALLTPGTHDAAAVAEARQAVLVANAGVVDSVAHGEPYYAASQIVDGGSPRAWGTVPLPTLAMIQAALPGPMMVVLQWALTAACLFAWWHRIAPALARPWIRIVALTLVAIGAALGWQYHAAPFHDLWGGLLIALSLALRTRDRWVESVALALAAALLADAAALYLIIMAAMALLAGDRREALGWGGAFAIFAVAALAHAQAVSEFARSLDPGTPAWGATAGIGFTTHAWSGATGLEQVPVTLAAPALVLSLIGWAGWRGQTGLRVVATMLAYLLLLSLVGGPGDASWALLIAPVSLAGLVFAPDALRDLVAAALDRRRITVRRVVR